MLNVVLLNFCYDVPVKLYSSHLLLIALFLLLPDAGSLWRLFVLGREAALTGLHLSPWERRPLRIASRVLQFLVIGGVLYQTGVASYRGWQERPTGRAPLYGMWTPDQPENPALPVPWATVVFDRPNQMVVVHPDGSRDAYTARFDASGQRIAFPEAEKPSEFHWTRGAEDELTLTGNWQGSAVDLTLHRKPVPETFALQTRGLHWVQEYPYNR